MRCTGKRVDHTFVRSVGRNMDNKENIKKGVPLIMPLQTGTETLSTKPSNDDIKKSIRLYIRVK